MVSSRLVVSTEGRSDSVNVSGSLRVCLPRRDLKSAETRIHGQDARWGVLNLSAQSLVGIDRFFHFGVDNPFAARAV